MIRMRLNYSLELKELNEPSTINKIETSMEELKISFRFAKGLVVMFCMYAFSTLSLWTIVIIDINKKMHPYFYMYPLLFIRSCGTAMPIVFPLFHTTLRRGYANVFRLVCLPKKKKEIKRVIYIHRRQLKKFPEKNLQNKEDPRLFAEIVNDF